MALEIESALRGVYHATEDELRAIDEADRGGTATEREVEAAFRAFRGHEGRIFRPRDRRPPSDFSG